MVRRYYSHSENLFALLGLFPDVLADERRQTAAVGGLALERITHASGFAVSYEFSHVRVDFRLGLDIVEGMFHCSIALSL